LSTNSIVGSVLTIVRTLLTNRPSI